MQPSDSSRTIVDMFLRRLATDGGREALLVRIDGRYRPLTWSELGRKAGALARWLGNAGVSPGDRVIQVSENRLEWLVTDLAIQLAGAIHVPVHASLTGPQIAYQIGGSGARLALLSTPEQADKLASCPELLPESLRCVSYDPCPERIRGKAPDTLSDLMSDAGEFDPERWSANGPDLSSDSWATILYTSGTTGEPKGVVLTQGNLASNALAALEVFGQIEDDLRLTFLPLSHIFARTADMYAWIASGCRLALAESRDTVVRDCAEISPTLLNGVPYFYDKLHRFLCSRDLDRKPGALRGLLGGQIRLCCSGGAALADHVFDFFWEQDVPMLQGYGLTETSPVISVSSETEYRRGASGKPVPGVEVRIAEDGEILTRGPHVMVGYYKDPDATDQMIRDGWLYTGDYGRLDDDGFLYVTGRKKEILVTTGGKNVAPVLLESKLAEDPLFQQVMVLGDQRNYLTALIVPEPESLRRELEELGITADAASREALDHPALTARVQQRIDRRLRDFSHYEQVCRFSLLEREFSIQREELTPKLSLRRAVIERNFRSEIEAMYAGEDRS